MTDDEILAALGGDSLLNRVRRIVSGYAGKAEQALWNGRPKTSMQLRREEFDAAEKIINLVSSEVAPRAARALLDEALNSGDGSYRP